MSTHDASPDNPTSTSSVRRKPVQAIVGLIVLFGVVGVVGKGAVGWARNLGILPYTGPIIEDASVDAETWDPSAPGLNIEATATPHRGPERYAACGFRVRVLSSADAGASVLAVYENCAPIDGPDDDKRVLAGENGIPVPLLSVNEIAIAQLPRGATVLLLVDELRGKDKEVVRENLASVSLPMRWSGWDLEHGQPRSPARDQAGEPHARSTTGAGEAGSPAVVLGERARELATGSPSARHSQLSGVFEKWESLSGARPGLSTIQVANGLCQVFFLIPVESINAQRERPSWTDDIASVLARLSGAPELAPRVGQELSAMAQAAVGDTYVDEQAPPLKLGRLGINGLEWQVGSLKLQDQWAREAPEKSWQIGLCGLVAELSLK